MDGIRTIIAKMDKNIYLTVFLVFVFVLNKF